jgi:glycylpeptide N-tetradecanoyltransferase
MIAKNKLPSQPTLQPHGLREMEERDVDAVMDLWMRYMNRFQMSPVLNREEVKHNLLGGCGKGEMIDGRREGQVVWTYVVENPETKKITDFFSFYSLPSSVMQSTKHPVLEAAYLFYYGTETAFTENAEQSGRLQRRLLDLIGDALVIAEQAHFDVFNALTLMDNSSVLTELKFGQGDGFLNYYLYNWRTAPMEGVNAIAGGQGVGRGVGVVML